MLAHDRRFLPHPRLPPYVFAEVNAMKAAARARGEDIVDLGMGNPDGAPPDACHRQAGRGRGQADRAPLFGVEGHPRPAQGPGRLLPAPLRGRARSRPRGDRHAGQQGGPRQPRPGDHRAGRRRADPQPQLSDPPFRLHHRRRRDPLDPRRARPGFLRPARNGDALHRAAAQGAGDRLSVATRPPRSSTSPSTSSWSPSPARHGLWVISDLAYAEIYFGDTPTPSILQVPGAKEVAVEFTSMSKTYSMAGWRMGFAVGNRDS